MSERGSEGRVLPKRIITPTPRDRDVESASLQLSGARCNRSHRPHLSPRPITGNRRHGKALLLDVRCSRFHRPNFS